VSINQQRPLPKKKPAKKTASVAETRAKEEGVRRRGKSKPIKKRTDSATHSADWFAVITPIVDRGLGTQFVPSNSPDDRLIQALRMSVFEEYTRGGDGSRRTEIPDFVTADGLDAFRWHLFKLRRAYSIGDQDPRGFEWLALALVLKHESAFLQIPLGNLLGLDDARGAPPSMNKRGPKKARRAGIPAMTKPHRRRAAQQDGERLLNFFEFAKRHWGFADEATARKLLLGQHPDGVTHIGPIDITRPDREIEDDVDKLVRRIRKLRGEGRRRAAKAS
jgi:hypothetical protein